MEDGYSLGTDIEIILTGLDLERGPSVYGIVPDQIGELFDRGRAVGRDKSNMLRRVRYREAQDQSAYAPQPVNGYFFS